MSRHNNGERTAEHVADILGISQQRVSNVEKNALRKLREAFVGEFEDYAPMTFVRAGRWNGRRMVRRAQ